MLDPDTEKAGRSSPRSRSPRSRSSTSSTRFDTRTRADDRRRGSREAPSPHRPIDQGPVKRSASRLRGRWAHSFPRLVRRRSLAGERSELRDMGLKSIYARSRSELDKMSVFERLGVGAKGAVRHDYRDRLGPLQGPSDHQGPDGRHEIGPAAGGGRRDEDRRDGRRVDQKGDSTPTRPRRSSQELGRFSAMGYVEGIEGQASVPSTTVMRGAFAVAGTRISRAARAMGAPRRYCQRRSVRHAHQWRRRPLKSHRRSPTRVTRAVPEPCRCLRAACARSRDPSADCPSPRCARISSPPGGCAPSRGGRAAAWGPIRLTKRELTELLALEAELRAEGAYKPMPKTRGECPPADEPCSHFACKFHLAISVSDLSGRSEARTRTRRRLGRPRGDGGDLLPSCRRRGSPVARGDGATAGMDPVNELARSRPRRSTRLRRAFQRNENLPPAVRAELARGCLAAKGLPGE